MRVRKMLVLESASTNMRVRKMQVQTLRVRPRGMENPSTEYANTKSSMPNDNPNNGKAYERRESYR